MLVANMIESYCSSSSTMEQTTKTPLKAQIEWIRIVRRHQRRSEQQRRHRRRKMNEFVSSSSLTTKRTTKTPLRAHQLLNRIGCVFINDEANNKDAAAGAMADVVQDDAANRMCNVPCIGGRRLMIQSMWLPGRQGRRTTTSNAPKKHENHEKHERAIWLSI